MSERTIRIGRVRAGGCERLAVERKFNMDRSGKSDEFTSRIRVVIRSVNCTQHFPAALIPSSSTHTHTHPFNGPLSGTTQVSRYLKGKTNLDFTEARDSDWQWHQLDHMQVCTLLQTDNHASTPPLSFYRPDALTAAQPIASKHALKASSSTYKVIPLGE